MLWLRKAIFKSKGDRLFSSAECRIESWEAWDTKSPAEWMPTHTPTELSRKQPVPMTGFSGTYSPADWIPAYTLTKLSKIMLNNWTKQPTLWCAAIQSTLRSLDAIAGIASALVLVMHAYLFCFSLFILRTGTCVDFGSNRLFSAGMAGFEPEASQGPIPQLTVSPLTNRLNYQGSS